MPYPSRHWKIYHSSHELYPRCLKGGARDAYCGCVSGLSAMLIRNKNTLSLNSQSHFLFPCLRVRASGQGAEEAELNRTCPYDPYTVATPFSFHMRTISYDILEMFLLTFLEIELHRNRRYCIEGYDNLTFSTIYITYSSCILYRL